MLTEKIRETNEPVLVFLDELPWLAERRSDLLAELDYFWNAYWSRIEHFKLVVCGSAASWILDNIINATGGLHNRTTERILLKPFNLSETRNYLEEKKVQLPYMLLLELYQCLGGVPYYLNRVEPHRSVPENHSAFMLRRRSATCRRVRLAF